MSADALCNSRLPKRSEERDCSKKVKRKERLNWVHLKQPTSNNLVISVSGARKGKIEWKLSKRLRLCGRYLSTVCQAANIEVKTESFLLEKHLLAIGRQTVSLPHGRCGIDKKAGKKVRVKTIGFGSSRNCCHHNGNNGQQPAQWANRWHAGAPKDADHHGDDCGMHRDTVAKGFLPDDGWAHSDENRHQGSSRIRLLRCCVRSGGNFCQHVDERSQPAESFPQTEYRTHSRRP